MKENSKNSTKTQNTKVTKEETKKVENNTAEKTKTQLSGNYITGIIGLILGGLIATIPWILVYVYGDMMFSVLSVFIAAGEFYGYKLFKGKIFKGLPILIIVMAIIIMALTTLAIIPSFLIMREGGIVSMAAIESLYQNEEFLSAILKDTTIAIVFTIIGASVITANIKKQIAIGNTEDIDISNSKETEKMKKEAIAKIKPIFEKFNALGKDHGILKDELNAEVEDEDLKSALNMLKSFKIVKKSGGRFYFDEQAENKQLKAKNPKKTNIITLVTGVVLVAIMVGVVLLNQMGILNKKVVSDDNISFEVNGKWIEYPSYYTKEWNYFRYINNVQPATDEEIDDSNYSAWPAYLSIGYSEIDTEQASSIQDIQTSIKEYTNGLDTPPSSYEDEITKTKNGYDVLKIKLKFEQEPNQVEFLNYILYQGELASIDAHSVNMKDESELEKTVDMITQSFKWKE